MVRYVECSWLADQILLKDFFGVGLVALAGVWMDVRFAFLFGKGLKQHHGPKIWGGNPLGPRIRTTSWPQALWREPVGNPHTAEASVAVAGVVVFWGFETGPFDQRISAFGPAASSRIDFWSCGHHSDKSVGRCQLAETDPRLLRCKRMLMRRHEARPVLNEFYVFLLRSRGGVMRSRKAEIWTFTRGERCPCSTVVHLG